LWSKFLAALWPPRSTFSPHLVRPRAGAVGGIRPRFHKHRLRSRSRNQTFGGLIANAISNPPGSRECDRGGNCGVPGLIAVAQTTAGAADNLRAVSRGDLEIALSQADTAYWAYFGTGAFANEEPMSNLRILARLYPENIHLIVRKDSLIKSVTDLKGKRVAVGLETSSTAATAKLILSAYGVKWNTVKFKYVDFALIAAGFAKNDFDAFFVVSGAPVLALEDLANRTPLRLVPINGPVAEKLAQVFPFYSRGMIPAGTYGLADPVETLDVGSVLVSRNTMTPELAYGIVRAIWHDRNVGLFQAGHPRGKYMDKNLAARNLVVPVTDGADRYYLLNNLMDPATVPPASVPAGSPAKLPAKIQATTAN
jgi:TRAP transporter TAXI family solute receptor